LVTAGRLLLRPHDFYDTARRKVLAAVGADLPVGDRYRPGGKSDGYDEIRAVSPTWNWEDGVVDRFLAGLPTGTTVLDVPFGSGRFVPLYEGYGIVFAGLDSSLDMITKARDRYPAACAQADLRVGWSTRLPFEDDAFEATLCFRFLPGIVDQPTARRTLEEIARVTRGTAVLQFKHAEADVPSRWTDRFSRLGARSPRQLEELLGGVGLRTTKVETMPGTNRVVYHCAPER
jgi:SAM-dependent methyltransferase